MAGATGKSRPVLTLMGTKEQFMDGALLYIRIYFAGAAGMWVYLIFPAAGTTTSLYLLYPVSWAITAAAETVYFAIMYKKAVKSIRPAPPDGEAGEGAAQ